MVTPAQSAYSAGSSRVKLPANRLELPVARGADLTRAAKAHHPRGHVGTWPFVAFVGRYDALVDGDPHERLATIFVIVECGALLGEQLITPTQKLGRVRFVHPMRREGDRPQSPSRQTQFQQKDGVHWAENNAHLLEHKRASLVTLADQE